MKFIHDFSEGIRAELIVTDDPPPRGESHVVRLNLYGRKAGRNLSEEYLQWMKQVNQILADRWGIEIGYAVKTGERRWELWDFAPNSQPILKGVIEP